MTPAQPSQGNHDLSLELILGHCQVPAEAGMPVDWPGLRLLRVSFYPTPSPLQRSSLATETEELGSEARRPGADPAPSLTCHEILPELPTCLCLPFVPEKCDDSSPL